MSDPERLYPGPSAMTDSEQTPATNNNNQRGSHEVEAVPEENNHRYPDDVSYFFFFKAMHLYTGKNPPPTFLGRVARALAR